MFWLRNELRQLAPQDPNLSRGIDSQFDFAVFDLCDCDHDLASDSDFVISFSGQYQHDFVCFLRRLLSRILDSYREIHCVGNMGVMWGSPGHAASNRFDSEF